MANDLEQNPFRIDTVGASYTKLTVVRSIRWVAKGASAGHQCIVKDPLTQRVLWESVASGANFLDKDLPIVVTWQNGFTVATLDSGVLYLATDKDLVLSSPPL